MNVNQYVEGLAVDWNLSSELHESTGIADVTEGLDVQLAANMTVELARHLSPVGQVFITFFYIIGISANVCSLMLLSRGETPRNRKQTVMVRCLAYSDLISLVGSFLVMNLRLYLSRPLVVTRWFCALRVLLRIFGLSSGCVAIVMAVERWLALTRPFLYQKHITYKLIKRAIFMLWLLVLLLVCLPFLGFGLYYDNDNKERRTPCMRYRFATRAKDVAYAYLVFTFGVVLCLMIVFCNLAVVRVLCRMGSKSMARMGRTTMSRDSRELSFNHTTPEELSFAKLMIILCVFFVVCWVPQMATIIMAQLNPANEHHPFYRIADIFIALNFTLDPIVYVLSRKPHRKGLRKLLKPLCHFCFPQSSQTGGSTRSNSQDPGKTTGGFSRSSTEKWSLKVQQAIRVPQVAPVEPARGDTQQNQL